MLQTDFAPYKQIPRVLGMKSLVGPAFLAGLSNETTGISQGFYCGRRQTHPHPARDALMKALPG